MTDVQLWAVAIVCGTGGILAWVKHVTSSKSIQLPPPRHPFARR